MAAAIILYYQCSLAYGMNGTTIAVVLVALAAVMVGLSFVAYTDLTVVSHAYATPQRSTNDPRDTRPPVCYTLIRC